jgi:hypothetical protein
MIGAGKRDSFISLDVSSQVVRYHRPVTVSGTLTRRSGAGIAGGHVRIYRRRPPRAWHQSTLTTGDNGGFSLQIAPRSKLKLRAVYQGGRRTWGSESRKRRVLVKPKVALEATAGVRIIDGIVHYPAGTTVVPLAGSVRPAHPGLKVRVRVSKYTSDGVAVRLVSAHPVMDPLGDFGFDFQVPQPETGLYQAVAKFFTDGDHTTAKSARVLFEVDP